MATTATPIFPQGLRNAAVGITAGTGTSVVTVVGAGANGTELSMVLATNTNATGDLNLYLTMASTNYLIGQVQIPANAGSVDSVPSVNILGSPQLAALPVDAYGNHILYLATGATLSAAMGATVTSGKQVTIIAMGGDF